MKHGFTLIELLIVVAIIAILAAIAVPNFLEAQVRAKVSRVKADQRTVGLALESYAIDGNGKYPPGRAVPLPIKLTTPIAYLSGALLEDPFLAGTKKFWFQGTSAYVYDSHYQYSAYPNSYNTTAKNCWFIASMGPAYTRWGLWSYVDTAVTGNPTMINNLRNTIYDPTNGTASIGYIMRGGGSADSGVLGTINK